jgi:hypothetical protein
VNVYECLNPACGLGTMFQRGRFTVGATRGYLSIVTGEPVTTESVTAEELAALEAEVLEGVCPTCGSTDTEVVGEHVPHEMAGDPLQALHDAVHARVLDPDDPVDHAHAQPVLKAMADG